MTRPFSDELLSAYLDDELSADERAAVEEHLEASPADRELLSELSSLRGELKSLPASAARDGFADRVVAAAVAAKARETSVGVTPVPPATGTAAAMKRPVWAYAAGVIALAAAACVVLVVGPWGGDAPIDGGNSVVVAPSEPTLAEQLVAQLRSAVPGEGEALVVRLRVSAKTPLGQSLDMALAEAGIFQRPASDTASGAVQVGAAYRQQVLQSLGVTQPGPPSPELISEAVFVEASLSQLEQVVAALSSEPSRALQLAAETKLAVALPTGSTGEGEGEDGHGGQSAGKGRNFSQRLNAGMFRLAKRDPANVQPAAVQPAAATLPQSPIRVLILVEQVDQ
jgi:anti-sigma factor RsiW